MLLIDGAETNVGHGPSILVAKHIYDDTNSETKALSIRVNAHLFALV